MPAGRPRIFEKPEDLEQAWNLYKKECKSNEDGDIKYLDKTGFCEWIKCYPEVISNLAKRPEFSSAISIINEDCKRELIERGLKEQYNASMAKFVLNCNYDMVEKSESKISGDKDNPIAITVTEIQDLKRRAAQEHDPPN